MCCSTPGLNPATATPLAFTAACSGKRHSLQLSIASIRGGDTRGQGETVSDLADVPLELNLRPPADQATVVGKPKAI